MICLYCGVEIKAPKRKFCCAGHKNTYNHKHLYSNKWANEYRGKSVENFVSSLVHHNGRGKFLTKDMLVDLYYKQNGICAISGVPMTHITGSGFVPTNASVDRIDSSVGYQEDNIQLVCRHVNSMKMTLTKEELIWWCEQIILNTKPK